MTDVADIAVTINARQYSEDWDRQTDRQSNTGSCGLNGFALASGATAHTCRYQHCAPTLHHNTHLSLPALCPNTAPQHTPVATSTVPQYCKFLSHRSEQTKVTFVRSRNVPPTFGLKHIYIPSIFCVYCLHSTCTKSIFCVRDLYSILCLYFNPHCLLSVNILCRLYRISCYILLTFCVNVYILSIFSLVSSIHIPCAYYTHPVYIPNIT